MTEFIEADFACGENLSSGSIDLVALLARLSQGGVELRAIPVDYIIDVLESFSEALLDRNNGLSQRYPNSGLAYIAHWCQRKNLENLVCQAFDSKLVLDNFQPSKARKDRAYRAMPRGLVVHWMAGNVPTLGFLSLLQGVLSKNANLIKLPKDADGLLGDLMRTLEGIKTEKLNGSDLTKAMAAIRYDHTRTDVGKILSMQADVRLMWGSDDSIEQIQSLPKKIGCHDMVFGSKTSMIVIDKETLDANNLSDTARRVALDISVFEQMACASPHTLFLETNDDDDVERFAGALQKALVRNLKTMPKMPASESW